MTDHRPLDRLIEELAADARPIAPLAPPWRRAAAILAVFAAIGGLMIAVSDTDALLARHAGREVLLASQMAAILATGVLAVAAAFFVAVPGRSPWWPLAPLPAFIAWLLLSGAGSYAIEAGTGGAWGAGHSLKCFVFIILTSTVLAALLVDRLSRAAPLEALCVALLAGLGCAALSAFLLAFFHPFEVTFPDLAVHVATILLVAGTLVLLRRVTLCPA